MSQEALRRAAILIATLDTESADALLSEMSPDQAALIRNAVMELGDIDVVEQGDIIEEFVGRPTETFDLLDDAVEVDPELARKFAGEPPAELRPAAEPPAEPAELPFTFLATYQPNDIAQALEGEHPQTTAIVAAHLPPDRAAAVIEHLPQQLRTETLMRIARLVAPHPDILKDLEQEIQARLSNRQPLDEVAADGLAHVEAILQSSSNSQRQALVADLSHQDRVLAGRLLTSSGPSVPATSNSNHDRHFQPAPVANGPAERRSIVGQYAAGSTQTAEQRTLGFADLESLDDADLALVLQRGSSNATLLALAGASHQFVRRILSQLNGREAAQLERKIQRIGPLRLDDVQRAQQQMVAIAQQLVEEGKLSLPGKTRLSVAA